ncbi:MAG: hypothetical protein JST54_03085 [Deltaproteobacteria bacterium]|nr:hypothetical protein [Deltaproteobacteria bacterium]
MLLALLGAGCSTTQFVQRDGCWIRRTESFPKVVHEEIGVCARQPPVWSNDRVARLVQECMAEADYRWQNEALAAWNRGLPLPPQRSEHEVMQQCMGEAATSVISENEALKKRLTELSSERDALRAEASRDKERLQQNQEHMTDALGEAAKRPAPNAFATSNSSGSATTRSDQESAQQPAPAQTLVPVPVMEQLPPRSGLAPGMERLKEKKKEPPAGCTLPGGKPGQECSPPPLPGTAEIK